MSKSTRLALLLGRLTVAARERGWTDSEWAARAGLRKETLSRLRRRETCDFASLQALCDAVGAQLGVVGPAEANGLPEGHFPPSLDRHYEERLVRLCASQTIDPAQWARLGPRFFMAGLAVMLAGVAGFDRRALLTLAEKLHPGVSEVAVFSLWLKKSPVRPSRFLPLLAKEVANAA
jgi:DNA-binding Xre family transcriptional regulator